MMEKNKYLIATITATAVSSSIISANTSAAVPIFSDISENNTHYSSVIELANRGIIQGYKNGEFGPKNIITRGQAAKIISGILSLKLEQATNTEFNDVSQDNPYASAIVTLKQLGIINGYTDGTFRPNAPITRNQMAKILTRAFNLKATENITLPFKDTQKSYQTAISALYQYGITSGTTATTFDGDKAVTREQFASFIIRAEKAYLQTQQEITLTIEAIKQQTLVAKQSYRLSNEVRALLNEENAKALVGATLQAKVVNDTVMSISSITLNTSGSIDAPITFNGNLSTLNGNLIINGDHIELKNLKVTGNLILTKNVLTSLTTNQLELQGNFTIEKNEANTTASLTPMANTSYLKISFTNSSIPIMTVKRTKVDITSNELISTVNLFDSVLDIILNTDINRLNTPENNVHSFNVSGSGRLNTLSILNTGTNASNNIPLNLNWNGTIDNLEHFNPAIRIQLPLNIKIKKLTLRTGVSLTNNFSNLNANLQNIENIQLDDGTPIQKPVISDNGNTTAPSASFVSVTNDEETLGLNGTGVISSDTGVATAQIANGKIIITSVKSGAATIKVNDATGREATIAITVQANGQLTIGTITKYIPIANDTVENNEATLGLVGTSVTSSHPNLATAQITNGKISITPIAPGAATITVTDAAGKEATIDITIAKNGSVSIDAIKKYTAKVTSAKWEKISGAIDHLLVTFSEAISVDNLSLAFDTAAPTAIQATDYVLTSGDSALTVTVPDIQTSADTVTITGIQYNNSPITIENQSITAVTAPSLQADTFLNTVDYTVEIGFADAEWSSSIYDILIDGVSVGTNNWTVLQNSIALNPAQIEGLQKAGDKTITIKARGYEDAVVTQTMLHGNFSVQKSTSEISPALQEGGTSTIKITVKDQYENAVSGYSIKFNVTIVDNDPTTNEEYTINTVPYENHVTLNEVSDENGEIIYEVVLPETIDQNDGIILQPFDLGNSYQFYKQ